MANDRRQQILDAALVCFNQHGMAQTTIDHIRQHSGASTGSVYHHFRNKEAIAAALYIEAMADHAKRLEQSLKPLNAETLEGLSLGVKAVVMNYGGWVEEHPELARFVFQGRSVVSNPEDRELLRRQNREHLDALRRFFQPGIETGRLRNLTLPLFHALIIGPVQDYSRSWLSGRGGESMADALPHLAEAAWRSVNASDAD